MKNLEILEEKREDLPYSFTLNLSFNIIIDNNSFFYQLFMEYFLNYLFKCYFMSIYTSYYIQHRLFFRYFMAIY